MTDSKIVITIVSFVLMMMFIFWRPRGLNETVSATLGAFMIVISGVVHFSDLIAISSKVSGAALTIISTLIMALVLESIGFFHWVATILVTKTRGSGIRLFWYTNLLCFLMTLFFNNDGSILITTPILLILLNRFRLKKHQKSPYLISGAIIATASSAPIGVSNMVNLISLKIIDMDLYVQTAMMFIPSMIGLLFLLGLLFLVFYKDIPKKLPSLSIPINFHNKLDHPLKNPQDDYMKISQKKIIWVLVFVLAVRVSLFFTSYIGIPLEVTAIISSIILLGWRWYYLKIKPYDLLMKAPWHILLFAFSMYVVVYGLNRIGLIHYLIKILNHYIGDDFLYLSFAMGGTLSILSNVFNNHPALMIGTLTLTEMNLPSPMLEIAYLASIIGSDIGSLLLPIGTLATLLWMHLLKEYNNKIAWSTYVKITFIVIPPTVIFTLIMLYHWISIVFLKS
ncbi:arsenite efflux membrane protein ArsB [Thermolongibacillus altinsuensis]|uniref:Arsenite efflux membrane protein ArsB n=1 Tax=Thermolongibacillus altinsuensis TaxID=575256 RepID=A0A4R1QNY3_9BACL|nr:arsenite efflux membrane protein ArsB [Thermolongibacillus altinsuensis]GMB09615.1 putative arsenical pump membrane protein [Thermolongibacillus altinsuensis]